MLLDRLLNRLLNGLIKTGSLTIIDAAGKSKSFEGSKDGPSVTMRIHDKAVQRRLSFNPSLTLGEAFMDGQITVENGDIYDLLEVITLNLGQGDDQQAIQRWLDALRKAKRRLTQYNPIGRARKNVAHHYDLSDTLYAMFLDNDRQYSCAYYMSETDSLERAQDNKKRHIAAKLLLEPGHKVLDIGSGWGGLALYLAQTSGADVTGITLSTEQQKIAQDRAAAAGLSDRVRFRLQDYRDETRKYDRIVSVGMFEHVGIGHYRKFFEKIRDLLTDDGVALLHTIGRAQGPSSTNPWIAKYIFPGGYNPAMSEIIPFIEATGMYITDIEVLRLHYARTLRDWRRRFNANRDKVREVYDERFCRMWEYYLAGAETAFRYGGKVNFQIQLAKRQDVVPATRDYIADWEAAHAGAATAASKSYPR
ncbi:MAG: class I SAM-dependent methyltransferase [Proteobacteria bacterium]|nr:class I SAM-dependent methyltransferase [Pseudomonadota bacterium]